MGLLLPALLEKLLLAGQRLLAPAERRVLVSARVRGADAGDLLALELFEVGFFHAHGPSLPCTKGPYAAAGPGGRMIERHSATGGAHEDEDTLAHRRVDGHRGARYRTSRHVGARGRHGRRGPRADQVEGPRHGLYAPRGQPRHV